MLSPPSTLIRLNLSENRIGDHGIKVLAQYIIDQNRDHLLSLNLEHNNVSTSGAITLLKAVQHSSIINLSLRKNRIFVHMCMFDFFKAVQLNFIRYFLKRGG